MIKKKYTEEQEKLARFAKAMGHPARIAILQFLASQESCFFGDIHEESYGISASERAERSRTYPRGNRNTESKILYQQGKLGNGKKDVCRFSWPTYM